MSQQELPTSVVERIRHFETPIIYAAGGDNIWHLPVVSGDDVTSLCNGRGPSHGWKATELNHFQRRWSVHMCKKCDTRSPHEHAVYTTHYILDRKGTEASYHPEKDCYAIEGRDVRRATVSEIQQATACRACGDTPDAAKIRHGEKA